MREIRNFRGTDWEKCLALHFLRSDGPFGSLPFRSLDATPMELARSTLLDGISAETAKESFLATFGEMDMTRNVLRGAIIPPSFSKEAPGYFRYLVLSTLVPALSPQDTATRNFRERLGELLRLDGSLSDVSGLPALWKRLVAWCEKQREEGRPYRRIVLPDPSPFHLIGYSIRLAFPSWRDRDRLTQDIRRLGGSKLRTPRTASAQLKHPIEFGPYSTPMKEAFEDFSRRFQSGERLLAHHRFWVLLQDVCSSLDGGSGETGKRPARLTLFFGTDESDVSVEFAGAAAAGRPASAPIDDVVLMEGSVPTVLGELAASNPRSGVVPLKISNAITTGVLLFSEEDWGQWLLVDSSVVHDTKVIALVRKNVAAGSRLPADVWHWAGGEWVYAKLKPVAVEMLLLSVKLYPETTQDDLGGLEIMGGVSTGQVLLGRSTILPEIRATASATISISPVGETRGRLAIEPTESERWKLVADSPIAGTWRVVAVEPSAFGATALESDLYIRFDDRAIEHETLADPDRDPTRLEPETEMVIDQGSQLDLRATGKTAGPLPHDERLNDLLEAIYARGHNGWSESQLVTLIGHVNGTIGSPNPWDILRILQEIGWIEPRLLKKWRGRRWFLRPPTIVVVGSGNATVCVLDGAIPLVVQERYVRVVERLEGFMVQSLSIGSWSPAMLASSGIDPDELGRALAMPVRREHKISASPAPSLWPMENRTTTHRECAGSWSWDRGCFAREADTGRMPVHLERYCRARGDVRDVFIVDARDRQPRAFTARTTAIMEAHRLAQLPLFSFDGTRLRRLTRDGHLPVPVGRMLRFEHLVNPGLLPMGDGKFCYAYPANQHDIGWLRELFGAAIPEARLPLVGMSASHVALARHRSPGRRLVWRDCLIDPRHPRLSRNGAG